MVQKISFVSVKVGEREYEMEQFIQVECVLCLIFAYRFDKQLQCVCAHCSALFWSQFFEI